jgi:hypothetical protein
MEPPQESCGERDFGAYDRKKTGIRDDGAHFDRAAFDCAPYLPGEEQADRQAEYDEDLASAR